MARWLGVKTPAEYNSIQQRGSMLDTGVEAVLSSMHLVLSVTKGWKDVVQNQPGVALDFWERP